MNSKPFCPECENHNVVFNMTAEDAIEMAMNQKPSSDDVSEKIYKKRLKICSTCKSLLGGMTCSHCGCFVAFRAKHKTSVCPEIPQKW